MSCKKSKYFIDKLGNVYYGNNRDGYTIIENKNIDDKLYVEIEGNLFYIPKLMLVTWVGDISLPIKCLNELKLSSRSVSYIINSYDIFIVDKDVITIKNIIFKKINRGTTGRYFISPSGIIFDTFTNRFVPHKINNDNYHIVILYKNSKPNQYMVHRLVYETYVGTISPKIEIDHLISKSKNSIFDIEPVTHFENIRRSNAVNSNYDETYIRKLCKLLSDGKSCVEIANIHGLFYGDKDYKNMLSYCNKLVNKKMYTHITDEYDFSKYYNRFDK